MKQKIEGEWVERLKKRVHDPKQYPITEPEMIDFISTEIEKAKAEAKQEVYLSMITSDLPTDYTGTATTPQEYSDNMKKFIKDEVEKHKIAIKRLKSL